MSKLGNYGTRLNKCCEAALSSVQDFDSISENQDIAKDKDNFVTCATCPKVIWYEVHEQETSDSDVGVLSKSKVMYYRTKV